MQLNVGDRASLTCSVVKGDVPLTITWRKDGRSIEISSQHHMSVKNVDQYNSILVIENLVADHTGNYSCCVRNLAAEVESSQSLLVNGNRVTTTTTTTTHLLFYIFFFFCFHYNFQFCLNFQFFFYIRVCYKMRICIRSEHT